MLSKKTRYALLALVSLAEEYGKGPVAIADIARKEHIPVRFLEGILLELRKNGMLASRLGKSGGYYLLKAPGEITLAEIISHFEGSLGMLACVCERSYQPCEFQKNEAQCKLRSVFSEVYRETVKTLGSTTLCDLIGERPDRNVPPGSKIVPESGSSR